MTSSKQVI